MQDKFAAVARELITVVLKVEADGTFEAHFTEDVLIERTELHPPLYTVVRKPRCVPGKTEASSLAEVEAVLGAALPAELHELYASGVEEIGDVRLLPIDEVLRVRSWFVELEESPQFWEQFVRYVGPPGAVRTVLWHPMWVPFGNNDMADSLCVDLAPGPNGRIGQVIQVCQDGEPLLHLADSVADWLRSPESLESPPPEDTFAGVGTDGVASLPKTVQQLSLHEPSALDCGRLARLTSLRYLMIGAAAP